MRYTEGQKLTFIRSTKNKTQFPDIPYYVSKVVTAPYSDTVVGVVVTPADDTTKGRYYTVTEMKALSERGVFVFDLPTDAGDPDGMDSCPFCGKHKVFCGMVVCADCGIATQACQMQKYDDETFICNTCATFRIGDKVKVFSQGFWSNGVIVSDVDGFWDVKISSAWTVHVLKEQSLAYLRQGDDAQRDPVEHATAVDTVAPEADASLKAYEFEVGDTFTMQSFNNKLVWIVGLNKIGFILNDDFGDVIYYSAEQIANRLNCQAWRYATIEERISHVDAKIIDTRKLLDSVRADLAALERQRNELYDKKLDAKLDASNAKWEAKRAERKREIADITSNWRNGKELCPNCFSKNLSVVVSSNRNKRSRDCGDCGYNDVVGNDDV